MLLEKKVEEIDGEARQARPGRRKSSLVTGNVRVAGRRTSVRLEPEMWTALNEIRDREGTTMPALVTQIQRGSLASTLTAAIRVYLLLYFRSAATEEGHLVAGHGHQAHRRPLELERLGA